MCIVAEAGLMPRGLNLVSASAVEFLELVVSNVACLSHDVVWCRMQNRREMVRFSQK